MTRIAKASATLGASRLKPPFGYEGTIINSIPRIFALVVWGALALCFGCERQPPLASEFELDVTPTIVTFSRLVTPNGPDLALCFEFDRPGDAHRASEIEIVLLAKNGAEVQLRAIVDQTGEAAMCLRDSTTRRLSYFGARIRAPYTMHIRKLDWGTQEQDDELNAL